MSVWEDLAARNKFGRWKEGLLHAPQFMGWKSLLCNSFFCLSREQGSGSSWPVSETLLLINSIPRAWETGRKHLLFPVVTSPAFQMIQWQQTGHETACLPWWQVLLQRERNTGKSSNKIKIQLHGADRAEISGKQSKCPHIWSQNDCHSHLAWVVMPRG